MIWVIWRRWWSWKVILSTIHMIRFVLVTGQHQMWYFIKTAIRIRKLKNQCRNRINQFSEKVINSSVCEYISALGSPFVLCVILLLLSLSKKFLVLCLYVKIEASFRAGFIIAEITTMNNAVMNRLPVNLQVAFLCGLIITLWTLCFFDGPIKLPLLN